MLRHYVEFVESKAREGTLKTTYGSEGQIAEVQDRDPSKIQLDEGAYAFFFFDQNVVLCEDGEIVCGKKKNFSGKYYYGEGPYTEVALLEKYGNKYMQEISICKGNHEAKVLEHAWQKSVWRTVTEPIEPPNGYVIAGDGKLYALYPKDEVLSVNG